MIQPEQNLLFTDQEKNLTMSKVIITYEARCKHCGHCETVKRKTVCKLKNEPIRQKDLACNDFKL